MAGTYQHYLQQMLQAGFKCAESGKRPSTWIYQKTGKIFRRRIEKFGGEDWFYSPTSDDSVKTLDDRISDWEAKRQADVRKWRTLPDGSPVQARAAAELAGLTGVRTKAIRQSFRTLFEKLPPALAEVLKDPDVLMARIDGLPQFTSFLETAVAQEFDLSEGDLETAREQIEFRAVMRMLKYAVSEVVSHRLSNALRELDCIFSGALTSEAFDVSRIHGVALEKLFDDGVARDDLLKLVWSVAVNTSPTPWILPDCAVLAFDQDGSYKPFLFGDNDTRAAVLLPLAPQRMLVGLVEGMDMPDLIGFTAAAASCSQDFFIASTHDPELDAYRSLIGSTETTEISQGLEKALRGVDPLRNDRDVDPVPKRSNLDVSSHNLKIDEPGLRAVAEPLCSEIFEVGRHFDLSLLNLVIVCADVPTAIADRRGNEIERYEETDTRNLLNWVQYGEEGLSYALCINATAANILNDFDHESHDYVLRVMIQSIAQIHNRTVLASVGESLPDFLEAYTDEDVGLWARDVAIESGLVFMDLISGSRIEAIDRSYFNTVAQQFNSALATFAEVPLPRDGDEEHRNSLAETFSSTAAHVLLSTCRHLAVCQSKRTNPLDCETEDLRASVEALDLVEWLARLNFDLQRLRVGFAAPLDPERIIVLQRHLERLFWARGAVLIAKDNGGHVLPFEDRDFAYSRLSSQLKENIHSVLPDDTLEYLNQSLSLDS